MTKESIAQPVITQQPVPAQESQQPQQAVPQEQQVTQAPQQEPQSVQPEPEKKEPSILEKVSQHKPNAPQTTDQETFFDYKQIEQIADPAAKEAAMAAYKSMQADYTRKTQDLASERKTLEQKLSETTNWSPEKIRDLVNNPNFVSNLQTYYNSQEIPNDEYLSEEEKRMKAELIQTQQQIQIMQSQQTQMLRQQQDAELSQKYASYDAGKVNQLFNDMVGGQYKATNEDIWKVVDYESAIQRAYEMGKTEERQGITEKSQLVSPTNGVQVTANTEIGAKADNESNKSYIGKILANNFQKAANQQRVKQ